MTFLPSKIPLIQAPMAGAQGPDLAIAVCRAGGLGSLPSAMLTPDLLREQIAAVRGQTEAPFNVNFLPCRACARSGNRGALARAARTLLC
jgi:nitronate monooxygenase